MIKLLVGLSFLYGICMTTNGVCSNLIEDDFAFQKTFLISACNDESKFEELYEKSLSKDKTDVLSLGAKYEENLRKDENKRIASLLLVISALKEEYLARSSISSIVSKKEFSDSIEKADLQKSFNLIDTIYKSY